MPAIIQVRELQKFFKVSVRKAGLMGALEALVAPEHKTVRAVDGVTFSMEEGELVGYLGPNGAGKSTTIKVLTGLLVPDGGQVWVDGITPWKNRTAYVGRIGAVFGQRTTLWWDLPVINSLELLRPMYRVPEVRFRRNLDEFVGLLEMEPFLGSPVRSLSLGQRMRADLCAALLHEPRLLFLDEPTIGLDVVAKERIRQFIQQIHRDRKTTIVLTTHDIADVEKLCERVLILDQGQLLYDGSLASLSARFEEKRTLVVTFAEDYECVDLPGIPAARSDGRRAEYSIDAREQTMAKVVEQLLGRYRIQDFEVRRSELEATIRRIYVERLLAPPAGGLAFSPEG